MKVKINLKISKSSIKMRYRRCMKTSLTMVQKMAKLKRRSGIKKGSR